jgi:hypothetical protein
MFTRLNGKRAGHSQVGKDETDHAATSPNDCRATRTKSARPSCLEATICWSEVRTEDVGTETGFARTLVDQVRSGVTCEKGSAAVLEWLAHRSRALTDRKVQKPVQRQAEVHGQHPQTLKRKRSESSKDTHHCEPVVSETPLERARFDMISDVMLF